MSPVFGSTPIPFDGNDYRKRVLAAIEARGGIQTSDPFEWYDVPLEQAESLKDRVVTDQIAAVWGFWQKQRDHPKYRGLVTALLAVHAQAAADLGEREARRRLAIQVRAGRAERDEDRFTELDGAIDRLVQRFGGIPRSKLEGLRDFAKQAGKLEAADIEKRLSRHKVVEDEPAPARPVQATVAPSAYRQVRADLEELGRILGTPPPVSLYDLLGLPPGAPAEQLSRARDQAAARNRELRPDRRRALVDDLLSAITALLLENDPQVYLDALLGEVTELLRPRVAAAVLVEDEFTAADYGHLLNEAEALGLDPARAVRALATLAHDLGVAVPTLTPADRERSASSGRSPARSGGSAASSGGSAVARATHEALSQARAALRAGRVREAQALVAQARQLAGGILPPIRAVGDEVEAVLEEGRLRWKAALAALTGNRYTEAEHTLARLLAIAADLQGPGGESVADTLAAARRGIATADAALAAALTQTGTGRELALLDAFGLAPDHPGLLGALEEIGVQPVTAVQVRRNGGYVIVTWARSGSVGKINYRVEQIDAAGARRAFGSTQGTELEAAVPVGAGYSRFSVVARRAGVGSPEALSAALDEPPVSSYSAYSKTRKPSAQPVTSPADQPGPPSRPATVVPATPQPVPTLELFPHGRRVRLVYPAPTSGRAEVRRLPDGAAPPAPGTVIADPASCGELVPGMGPGLAVDRRPDVPTAYLVLSIDSGRAVAGASTWHIALPPVTGLHVAEGRLRWDWPAGCTEVVLIWRADAAPEGADDPAATRRKVTNTRYEIDGGVVPPAEAPLHVAVFTCTRRGGTLVTAAEATRYAME